MMKELISILFPRENVDADLIVPRVLSWMTSAHTIQSKHKLVLKWMVQTRHMFQPRFVWKEYLGVLFYLLQYDTLRPFIVHLLVHAAEFQGNLSMLRIRQLYLLTFLGFTHFYSDLD